MSREVKDTETTDYSEARSEGYRDYRLPTTVSREVKDTETTDYSEARSEGYRDYRQQ